MQELEEVGTPEEAAASTPVEPDASATEAGAEAQPSEAQQSTISPYTDQEVQQILESDGKLDSNRLTPVQKLTQRSFEKYWQKKYQEGAESQRKTQEPPKQPSQPSTLQDQYFQNPDAVMKQLDFSILQAYKEGDLEKAAQIQIVARQLEREGQKKVFQEVLSPLLEDKLIASIEETANKEIPNFKAKKEKLNEFYSDKIPKEYLSAITAPGNYGEAPISLIKILNEYYEMKTAVVKTKDKEVKPTPNKLERPSISQGVEEKESDPGTWSYEKYVQARRSGKLR